MMRALTAGDWITGLSEDSLAVKAREAQEERFYGMAPAHLQPEAVHAAKEIFQVYRRAIDTLPPRCREAFALHVFEELSNAEIASRMGVSLSMIEKYLARGKATCKLCRARLES
ncbi:MAG: sigma-70 family RNA polymerase sigma factor [Candidatus Accumulibacter sp.]|jgi:RNA polymerase sigma-70 factor (ECF subfamily)|nr:sigma-70 family RNA polymerase sigma factor [Accumulibacter sp.]